MGTLWQFAHALLRICRLYHYLYIKTTPMPKSAIPDFPTPVSIWTGANTVQPATTPRVTTTGQLILPPLQNFPMSSSVFWVNRIALLLLPTGTDVRGSEGNGPVDYMQIPDLSNNWFLVGSVMDRWLGYPGHHLAVAVLAHGGLYPHSGALGRPTIVPIIPSGARPPFNP